MTTRSTKPGRVLLRRLAWGVGIAAGLYYAMEGGEYGTRDLWAQTGRKAQLNAEIDQLKIGVDSLRRELKAIKTDNDRLERVAREKWGMVRGGKEILYWVGNGTKPATDTASTDTATRRLN